MQRDVTNEIIVAAVAVLIIVLGLVLGVLLSLSSGVNNQSVAPTNVTDVAVIASEPAESMTTNVTTLESATETITPTLELEPTLTYTATDEVTATDSATETSVATPTETPSATPTERPTVTETSSRTPRPTRPSTFTPEPTETDTPTTTATVTPSPEDTATDVVVMATVTPSKTRTPDATATEQETVETDTPEATATEAKTVTVTPTERICYRPAGWVDYVIKRGDTLFKIAQAVGSTVSELQRVNCIDDKDRIITGTRLYVPNHGASNNDDLSDSPGGGSYGRIGCSDPNVARIANLYTLQRVGSSFSVSGTAYLDDFWYYKLEIQSAETGEIHFWLDSQTPVKNGFLGQIITDGFGSGIYLVRLVVVYPRGDTPPENICAIPVYFP